MAVFERTIQLIGEESFAVLQQSRVILFGVGGVGGWTAETLIRSGVGHLTLVDYDTVQESNLNRQLVATAGCIGEEKVSAMRRRLLEVIPSANIQTVQCEYNEQTYGQFDFSGYDLVIDAIDNVSSKVRLIYEATHSGTPLLSSMGAGRKVDVSQVRVSDFGKVAGCPLARAIRKRMKATGLYPQRKFPCVWSPEQVLNQSGQRAAKGTVAPIVGMFGMMLAGLALQTLQNKEKEVDTASEKE